MHVNSCNYVEHFAADQEFTVSCYRDLKSATSLKTDFSLHSTPVWKINDERYISVSDHQPLYT